MKKVLALLLTMSLIVPIFIKEHHVKAADIITKDYDAMSIEELMNSEETLTWLFTGDSITHNSRFTSGMNSYVEWFEQYLYGVETRKRDRVINSAWGGAVIQDFLTAEDADLAGNALATGEGVEEFITKYNPDVIFVKLGMNNRAKMSSNAFQMHYRQMIDAVYDICQKQYAKKPKIILLSTTPLTTDERDYKIGTYERCEDTKEVAEKYGLIFSDLRSAFFDEKDRLGEAYLNTLYNASTGETVHPNEVGQYVIFKTLAKSMGIYNEEQSIFHIEYSDILKPSLYTDKTTNVNYQVRSEDSSIVRNVKWDDAFADNSVWMVAGGMQVSDYIGNYPNRSMLRLIENGIRHGNHHRDIRIIPICAQDYHVKTLLAEYDTVIGEQDHQVCLLIPDIPGLYMEDYKHSENAVLVYRNAITDLLSKEKTAGKLCVLWTPFAVGDETLNSYVDDYAQTVREIAKSDMDILFFDANAFMNQNMNHNESLKNNWFEANANTSITPLGAADVAHAFVQLLDEHVTKKVGTEQLTYYTLRYGSDKRLSRSTIIRDHLLPDSVTVDGEKITIDLTTIKEAYKLASVSFAVLPERNAGDNQKDVIQIEKVSVDGNRYTFKAPCSNPIIAIYGQGEVQSYRFADMEVEVTVSEFNFLPIIIGAGVVVMAAGVIAGVLISKKKK